MLELLSSREDPLNITTPFGTNVTEDNVSQPYNENDPRRCYVLGEADACVK